ncbi:hypothetical protein ACO0QE_003383 [Hanseniaspora vineae]
MSDSGDGHSNSSLQESSTESVSVKIKEISLCLDANLRSAKDLSKSRSSENIFGPTFQFDDLNWYTYVHETSVEELNDTQRLKSTDDAAIELNKFAFTKRKSYNYSALLKLNKLLEYHYELGQEITTLKDEIDVNYQLRDECFKKTKPLFQIHAAIDQLELDLQKQQNDKLKQEGKIDKLKFTQISARERLKEPVDVPLSDDSNDMIKDYKRQKQQLTELKIRKIQKLLNIFESCNVVSGLYSAKILNKQVFSFMAVHL